MNKTLLFLTTLFLSAVFVSCARNTAPPSQVQKPEALAAAVPQAETREPAAHAFFDMLVSRDFSGAEKMLDATMLKVMPALKLSETWDSVLKQYGGLQDKVQTGSAREKGYDIVTVTGKFTRGFLDTRIVFDASGKIAGLFFKPVQDPAASKTDKQSPSYVKKNSFTEKTVTIISNPAYPLSGTLALPNGKGPFTAVVLVHGSGPSDRDETIGPNKPFRDIAWGLASQGIAVLRYEKRSFKYGMDLAAMANLTVREETIDDAAAAATLLRGTPGIDPKKIFLLGHSLGGMLVPRIALANPDIAGFIILAGLTRPLPETIAEQVRYIAMLDGKLSDEESVRLREIQEHVARIKNLTPASKDAPELLLGIPASYWLDLNSYNPAEAARSLKKPILIMQGGRDYQVTEADFNTWKKSLADRGDVQALWYPELNHLFITGKGVITPEEYGVEGHVAEQPLKDMAIFLKKAVN